MAYGFEKRMGKTDPDVQFYLEENMLFSAWIMIIRHWEGNTEEEWDKLYEELERENYKKSRTLTDEDMISLDYEFFDYRRMAIGY